MVYKCVMKAGQEHKHCVGVGVGLILSFATDSYFRHWKALKILRFDSGLYRLCGKVSVLLAEKGGEKENLFKWKCLLSSSVSWGSAEMGEGGSTLSLSQPGVLWPLSRTVPFSVLQKHSSKASLPWIVLAGDGFPREASGEVQWQPWCMAWAVQRRGGGFFGAPHPKLCHLYPPDAFDSLAFRRLHVKSVMEQWMQPPSRPKIHLAAPTPQSASSSSVHCTWGNSLVKKIFIVKPKKDSWDAFPCFPKVLKLEALGFI